MKTILLSILVGIGAFDAIDYKTLEKSSGYAVKADNSETMLAQETLKMMSGSGLKSSQTLSIKGATSSIKFEAGEKLSFVVRTPKNMDRFSLVKFEKTDKKRVAEYEYSATNSDKSKKINFATIKATVLDKELGVFKLSTLGNLDAGSYGIIFGTNNGNILTGYPDSYTCLTFEVE